MSRKTEAIIAIAIILALVIVLFVLWRKPQDENPSETETDTGPAVQDDVKIPHVDPEDIPAQDEVSATTVTRVFVERFGSYSTESGYENIDDLMGMATASMQRRLDALAESARQTADDNYYGVSTRIMSVKTEVSSETEARFLVTTQREESFDTPGNTSVRYQDIRVSLLKEGEDWLVDDFTWLE